jgi:sugar lactone lactonase YvrE
VMRRCGAGHSLTGLVCAVAAALPAIAGGPAAGAEQPERAPLDVRLFARIGLPGQPEGIAIGPDRRVYVSTHQGGRGDASAPSKVFALDADGRLAREYVVEGQNLDDSPGLQGIAFDGRGLLYVADVSPARILRIDPATGAQRTYASIPDLAPCEEGQSGPCSKTGGDQPPDLDGLAFGPDGSLYATDLLQAVIWRIPPGGGAPQVLLSDAALESPFGPNGIAVLRDGRSLLFVQTANGITAGLAGATGRIYRVDLDSAGRPGALRTVWNSRDGEGPDGLAVAESGNLFVVLAAVNQVVELSPAGAELGRAPASPAANALLEVPFDSPASPAFLGDRLLVTNQATFTSNPMSWAVLDVNAGEPGRPPFLPEPDGPSAPRPKRSLRMSVSPRSIAACRATRLRFTVTRPGPAGRLPAAGARVRFGGRRLRAGRAGRAAATVRLCSPGLRRAVSSLPGLRPSVVRVRVRGSR